MGDSAILSSLFSSRVFLLAVLVSLIAPSGFLPRRNRASFSAFSSAVLADVKISGVALTDFSLKGESAIWLVIFFLIVPSSLIAAFK